MNFQTVIPDLNEKLNEPIVLFHSPSQRLICDFISANGSRFRVFQIRVISAEKKGKRFYFRRQCSLYLEDPLVSSGALTLSS